MDTKGVSPENSTHVYFRDVILPASDEDEEEGSDQGSQEAADVGPACDTPDRGKIHRRRVDKQKLIIILVGLPGRGKTFLCNKLMCYLNWCGRPLSTLVGVTRFAGSAVHLLLEQPLPPASAITV